MEKRLTMSLADIIESKKGKPSNRGNVAADKQTKVRAGRATSATLVFWRTSIVHWRAFRRLAVHTGGQTGAVLRLCSTSIGSSEHWKYCEGNFLRAACTYTVAVELHAFAAAQVELLAATARLWHPDANSVGLRKLFSSLSQCGTPIAVC